MLMLQIDRWELSNRAFVFDLERPVSICCVGDQLPPGAERVDDAKGRLAQKLQRP